MYFSFYFDFLYNYNYGQRIFSPLNEGIELIKICYYISIKNITSYLLQRTFNGLKRKENSEKL